MTDGNLSPNRDSQHDEEVWNAWLQKNIEKDRVHFLKLAKIAGFAAALVVVLFFVWAWKTQVYRRAAVRIVATELQIQMTTIAKLNF